MCSYLKLEIKSFVSLKNESFLFWMRVHFKAVWGGGGGEVKSSKILGGGAHKGGADRFRIFFLGGGVAGWRGGGGEMGLGKNR